MKLLHLSMRAMMACTGLGLCLAASASAQAQHEEPALPRFVAAASAGVPLRLTRNVDLGQSTFAPVFVDLMAGYVFRGSGELQHGFGLGASFNLTADGGFSEPVGAGSQVVVMPAYLLAWNPNPDVFGLGHAGVPLSFGGTTAVGLELAAALGYRWLAGVSPFAELGLQVFRGVGGTLHPTLSLELGVAFEYEVLP